MARLRFFAGKGGVGKTTCATAYAVACARAGHQTLLISTDPAPSVGDALRQPLSSSPRLVSGTRGRLRAVEVNATAALERWLRPRRGAFETIVLRGSWFDEADVRTLLRLSLPGIDEVAALIEIGRYARAGRYDYVIVDTAPTGHTLRMVGMPALLGTLAEVFDHMAEKYRALVAALRGAWTPEEPDTRISELDAEARYLTALLRDRDQTVVTWITLPEEMAIAETLDGLAELRHLDMHVDTVVINRLTAAPDRSCRWCAARRRTERAVIQPLVRRPPGSARLAAIHAQSGEPVGAARLMPLAREMERTARFLTPRWLPTGRLVGQPALSGDMVTLTNGAVSLLLFGGKGGVGKTTCAAAAAVDLASLYPDRAVLLLSTDPAHSLGDVLGVALGNDARPVPGGPRNLQARELDAAAGFTAIKARYRDAIDGLFARLLPEGAISVEGDRRTFRDLLELAPPGLDELMAIVEVSDALYAADASRLLVIDTAPTGHALRLLEMPTLVHDWVKALMRILLKYQTLTRAGDLGVLLVQMSRGLTRLRAVLVDPSRTAFVGVSRTGALPLAETERMIQRIRRLRIPIVSVLVNAVGAGQCTRCQRARLEQDQTLTAVRRSRTLARYALIVAPAVVPPPRGPNELRDWRNMWRTGPGAISSRAWKGRREGRVKRK